MNQRVAIFGATSAIAGAVARIYAERGAELFLVARDAGRLEAVRADLLARGAASAESVAADLADTSRGAELADQAFEKLGGLDVALVAHGVLGDHARSTADFSQAERELGVNLLSPLALLTALAAKFESQGRGTIAAISSVAGDRGRQSNYVYGTAKGALSIYLAGLRNRLFRSGVHVLTIKPGFVDTPMTAGFKKGPLWASPAQVAEGIVKAIERKRDVVYVPWFWRPIMMVITAIPETIFKRLRL